MLSILRPLDATLRLQKLLFEFKEPFDKECARKDWHYGGRAQLTKKSLLFYYLQLFTHFIEIPRIVFDPYKRYDNNFVEPDRIFTNDYSGLITPLLADFQLQWYLRELPQIDLTSFETITGDYYRLIKAWHEQKGKLDDYKERVNILCVRSSVGKYPIPFRLQEIFNEMHTHLENHRAKQQPTLVNIITSTSLPNNFQWDKEIPYLYRFGTFGQIAFTGKRYTLFKLLADARSWVTVEDMVSIGI